MSLQTSHVCASSDSTLHAHHAGQVRLWCTTTSAAALVSYLCLTRFTKDYPHDPRSDNTDILQLRAVFDEDRVALNAMKFSSPRSAGASCMVMDGNGAAPSNTTHAVDHSMDQVRKC